MKKAVFTVLALLLMATTSGLVAQTFEEYKKQQQQQMQEFAQNQQEGIEKLRKEYADYVARRDKEWQDYLLKEWESFHVFSGKKAPERPKPATIPAYVPPVKVLTPDAGQADDRVTVPSASKPTVTPPAGTPTAKVTPPAGTPTAKVTPPSGTPTVTPPSAMPTALTTPPDKPTIIPQPTPRPVVQPPVPQLVEIGRASWRETVLISVVAG